MQKVIDKTITKKSKDQNEDYNHKSKNKEKSEKKERKDKKDREKDREANTKMNTIQHDNHSTNDHGYKPDDKNLNISIKSLKTHNFRATNINIDNHSDELDKSQNDQSSSGHDSIIYTKNINKNVSDIINTIESCTSSEFRAGLDICDESSFISNGNKDVENLNIDIKHSNI